MRRAVLGILALLLLGGGLALYLSGLESSVSSFSSGVMVKCGAVLFLFWLAYHQVLRLFEIVPPWMIGVGILGLGAVIVYPKSIVVVLCLIGAMAVLHVAGMFLKPSAKRAARARPRSPVAKPSHKRE